MDYQNKLFMHKLIAWSRAGTAFSNEEVQTALLPEMDGFKKDHSCSAVFCIFRQRGRNFHKDMV